MLAALAGVFFATGIALLYFLGGFALAVMPTKIEENDYE